MSKKDIIYCPYCGPWNGEPDGVPMDVVPAITDENGRVIDWCCECPVCWTRSPEYATRKQAIAAAKRRFNSPS